MSYSLATVRADEAARAVVREIMSDTAQYTIPASAIVPAIKRRGRVAGARPCEGKRSNGRAASALELTHEGIPGRPSCGFLRTADVSGPVQARDIQERAPDTIVSRETRH